jgi:hypothetical protein
MATTLTHSEMRQADEEIGTSDLDRHIRRVLELHFIDGYSYPEVDELLGFDEEVYGGQASWKLSRTGAFQRARRLGGY